MENFKENAKESTLETLKQQLKDAGIDISKWGKGQAKTLKQLQKEIENGETILVIDKQGKLLRKVAVGGSNIFYTSPEGKKYRLKEDKQVFKDGRERKRDLGQAVLEKMKSNEEPKDAMIRGIREELGIKGEIYLTKTGTEEQLLSSPSYPNLVSQYIRHKFEATLNDQQFKADGYIEEQEDKNTYFVWEEIK